MDKNSDNMPKWWVISLVLIVLIIYGAPGFHSWFYKAEPRLVVPRGDLAANEQTAVNIFRQTSPSVVYISTLENVFDFREFNFTQVPNGTGTGFFWDDSGHIVTNFHVVRGAQAAVVYLHDKNQYEAKYVGASPAHDLAVLKIDIDKNASPQPIPLGSSNNLEVGQSVFAIGNPFGFDYTLTRGIISALGRSLNKEDGLTLQDLIQIDAAINAGNSGGPLLDSAGRLIGVNTAIIKGSVGIGFSVPVDTLNRVVPDLINYGRYRRPSLGINYNENLNRKLNQIYKIPGVIVTDVVPGSGAEKAGIQGIYQQNGNLGDIIIAVNEQPVNTLPDLLDIMNSGKLSNTAKVTILRGKKQLVVTVKLSTN